MSDKPETILILEDEPGVARFRSTLDRTTVGDSLG
jgi:hypothetical protein